jgi:hypothetical protein
MITYESLRCVLTRSTARKRAEQVKHMAKIYRNAARTLIWRGPEYDDSHNTISQLVKIGHIHRKLPDLLKPAVMGGDPNQTMTEFSNQFLEIFSQYLCDLPLALKFLKSIFFVVVPAVLVSGLDYPRVCGLAKLSSFLWQG